MRYATEFDRGIIADDGTSARTLNPQHPSIVAVT